MKKLMKSLMLFAAAAMALTSCENEAMNEGIEANDTFTLSFTADAPESKTSVTIVDNAANFDWSEGDQVAFVQWANGANKINKKKSEAADIAANGSATFTSEFDSVDGVVTSYDYAAIYPDANWKSNTDFSEVTAVVPSTQTLTDNTYDPAADLMMSKAILDVANKDGHGGKLVFHRLAAIGRMNLKGIPAGEIIQTVTITFEEAVLNGDVTINFTAGTAAYATTGSNVVTLNNGNLTAVTENPIFFTCFPGEYTGAYTFDVETDKAYYQKTGTINAEKPLTFTAGNVMGFSTTVSKTNDKATDKVYTKVTKNNLADYSGEYLLVCESKNIAFDGSGTTSAALDKDNNTFSVEIVDGTITGDYTAKSFTIAKVDGGYSVLAAGGLYIGNSGTGNGMSENATYSAGTYLNTIENCVLKGKGGLAMQVYSSGSNNRFRYYTSGKEAVSLYRLNGTGSDEELVKALESIEVSGAKTTFTVGDEWAFGGTVTAKYNDNSTEDVTEDATVNNSEVNLGTAGEYTVTVTYEGKTATYTITVNEEPQDDDVVAEGWYLVEDASTLAVGDKIVITNQDATYAISTNQKSNNREAKPVTKNANNNTITIDSNIQEIELKAGNSSGTFAFYVTGTNTGYLYAGSSTGNQLKTKATLDNHGSWTISISNGVASIQAKQSSNRNVMQYNYNSGTPLFACYASASQTALAIYKYVSGGSETPDPEEPTIVAPTITIDNITDVSAAGVTNAEQTVGLGSPVGEWTYTVTSEATWLSNMSLSEGKVIYTVAANNSDARNATVTITASCDGQTDVTKTFTIAQLAGESGGGDVEESKTYTEDFTTWTNNGQSNADTGTTTGNACTWTWQGASKQYWSNISSGSSLSNAITLLKPANADGTYVLSETLDGGIKSLTLTARSNNTGTGVNIYVIDVATGTTHKVGTLDTKSKKTDATATYDLTSLNITGQYQIKIANKSTTAYCCIGGLTWSN